MVETIEQTASAEENVEKVEKVEKKDATILFVDDEKNILNALRRVFRNHKHWKILTAQSPKEAIAILSEHKISVLVTDHKMPQMEGAELLAKIRNKRPNTIKIMLTGQADNEAVMKAINDGDIYKYIIKPWDDQKLIDLIEEAVELYKVKVSEQKEKTLSEKEKMELKQHKEELEKKFDQRTEQLQDTLYTIKDLNSKVQTFMHDTTKLLLQVIELARPQLGAYSRKVLETSIRICQKINLPKNEIMEIETSAMLHDIGKIDYPMFMLEKTVVDYTEEELEMYYKHPQIGYKILSTIPEFNNIATIVSMHHEKLNGTGFPNHVVGHNIPRQSLIIGITEEYLQLKNRQYNSVDYYFQYAHQYFQDRIDKEYPADLVEAIIKIMTEDCDDTRNSDEITVSLKNLLPSMKLSRNLYTMSGTLLLAAGTVLDFQKINRIREFTRIDSLVSDIYVSRERKVKK